jgi:hypothetical protein
MISTSMEGRQAMIRVAARQSYGTTLKMDAHVNSLEDAGDLLHAELKAKKIPTGALVAIQLTQSKQTGGGLQVLGQQPLTQATGAA